MGPTTIKSALRLFNHIITLRPHLGTLKTSQQLSQKWKNISPKVSFTALIQSLDILGVSILIELAYVARNAVMSFLMKLV